MNQNRPLRSTSWSANPDRLAVKAIPQLIRQRAFQHREFDIVVDNPPFSKPNADSGSSIPKPVFEGSERSQEDTTAMRRALRKEDIRVANGQAGLASYFVDLADRMLKSNGKSTMGFILPATAPRFSTLAKSPRYVGN